MCNCALLGRKAWQAVADGALSLTHAHAASALDARHACRLVQAGLVLGSLITLGSAGIYTYFKISKILEKDEGCVKKNEDFKKCCGAMPCCKQAEAI